MKTCDIVQDLLPLYVEGLTRPDSTAMVETHLATCDACRKAYEWIKEDYQRHEPLPEQEQVDALVRRIARYQKNIKLAAMLAAMLMSCIFVGAEVEFLSTLPWLILTPFVCRLFYHKSVPILAASILFGILGGVLNENDTYVLFFTFVSFLTAAVGVGAAVLVQTGFRQRPVWLKVVLIAPGIALVAAGCLGFFSFYGNPVGYMEALFKTNRYVNETYEEGTLTFKGVFYNFKDNRHYGRFEFVLDGIRQEASIGFARNGQVLDEYQWVLEMKFAEERSSELKTVLAAAVEETPVTVTAKPEGKLFITRDDLNHQYYLLSYDPTRWKEATERRKRESGKLRYEIFLAPFPEEYIRLSKEEFLAKSEAIFNSLKDRDILFRQVDIKAADLNGQLQRVTFEKGDSLDDMMNSYAVEQ